MVHLNRQAAHLQNALQESKVLLIELKPPTSFTDYLHDCRLKLTSGRSGAQTAEYNQQHVKHSYTENVGKLFGLSQSMF